jgi:hypothetical protein
MQIIFYELYAHNILVFILLLQNLNKNKAKQPEMVEDSDISEEEFVMHEKEQKEDADVMDLSDFSDLPSDNKNNDDVDSKEDNAMEISS